MDEKLFSDEIRERERKRRRKDLLWSVVSFVLHVVLFGAIVMLTPVKSLVFDKEKKKANPAADLSADRIEQIADSLSQARINELLKQLEALQTVLHNMDLMKEELQKDYDSFAEQSSVNIKEELSKMIDEVEKAQKAAQAEQAPMVGKVEKMLAEERLDLVDEARSKWLSEAAFNLITVDGDKVGDAQARAGNTLDRIHVQVQFGGFRKTAEASENVRDAQLEAAITESYKDIKATQTAIERKMSYEAAQKITDVAKAVRMEANREAIEDNPRTKEALDAQKVAQAEVVRETDNIVETVVAMMEEAMELVRPDDPSKAGVKRTSPKTVQ